MRYDCIIIDGYLDLYQFCKEATKKHYTIIGITQDPRDGSYTVVYGEEIL